MIPRLLNLPLDQNILLFGARGTGKSTLIRHLFPKEFAHWINLLDAEDERIFSKNPNELQIVAKSLPPHITHIVIDEIQKIPKLLDIVHLLIEETSLKFVMTGSSARKLKQGGVNLLAGRAFIFHLFPFSFMEIPGEEKLTDWLLYGQQPKIIDLTRDEDKKRYLRSYANAYLKEEIVAEQIVKNLTPFRRFLEVAAQSNGKIVNYANIARDCGTTDITVKNYFSILEDTLMGFLLEPFSSSFRKRLSQKPKFYFFDTGIARALSHTVAVPLLPQTTAYGDAFEHLVILEAMRLASYYFPDYRFSYVHTKDDAEIDLVVERPGLPLLCIEIKSASHVDETFLGSFPQLVNDLPNAEAILLCNDKRTKRYGNITVMPWMEGLRKYFAA